MAPQTDGDDGDSDVVRNVIDRRDRASRNSRPNAGEIDIMRRRLLLATAAALTAAPRLATAQSRPVRVIVPFAPGGQSDTVMRLLQPRMSEHLGVPVVVENRPGAGGAVGAGVVAASPADGTTLFFDSFGFVVQPLVQRGLPFDYATAFAPVAQVVA